MIFSSSCADLEVEEQASASAASSAPRSLGPSGSAKPRVGSLNSEESPGRGPLTGDSGNSHEPHRQDSYQGRVEGPTSISFLLHSTASLPSTATETFDLKHHNSWEVTADGNGVIRVNAPPRDDVINGVSTPPGSTNHDSTKEHSLLNKPVLSAQLVSMLVNSYFEHMSPMFPIVSRADFTRTPNPSPFLLYAICGIASTRRNVPREVFSAVRGMINGIIRSNDVLSDAKLEHVQALVSINDSSRLLIISLSLHKSVTFTLSLQLRRRQQLWLVQQLQFEWYVYSANTSSLTIRPKTLVSIVKPPIELTLPKICTILS